MKTFRPKRDIANVSDRLSHIPGRFHDLFRIDHETVRNTRANDQGTGTTFIKMLLIQIFHRP